MAPKHTLRLAHLAVLSSLASATIPPAPVEHGDGVSSTLQLLIAETNRKTEAEQTLNQCFTDAYTAMAKGE